MQYRRLEQTADLYVGYHADVQVCRKILSKGSKSFNHASWLLPQELRQACSAVYAFCRLADDAVDQGDPTHALADLHQSLDRVYAGQGQGAVERALAAVVSQYQLPRLVFDALLEGFEWDIENRRYASITSLEDYCARVASTVGTLLTLIAGVREPRVVARACELGLAMQLTNIARDVGEDARNHRVYLPLDWLHDAELEPDSLVAKPSYGPAIASVIKRVLDHAQQYYQSAFAGLPYLPKSTQGAFRAAGLIYADIGRVLAGFNYDSINRRAYTSTGRKLWLLLRAMFAYSSDRQPLDSDTSIALRFLMHAGEYKPTGYQAESRRAV